MQAFDYADLTYECSAQSLERPNEIQAPAAWAEAHPDGCVVPHLAAAVTVQEVDVARRQR